MNFRLALILLIITILFSSGCNSGDSDSVKNESLTVSAVVSLKNAFTEIGELCKAKTGKSVNFNNLTFI